jgi:predicted DNA-binding transcriptional regulator AlpA
VLTLQELNGGVPDMTGPVTKYLPRRQVAEKFLISERTVDRWERDPELDFPAPADVNGRFYWSEAALDRWMASRAVKAPKAVKRHAAALSNPVVDDQAHARPTPPPRPRSPQCPMLSKRLLKTTPGASLRRSQAASGKL